MNIQDDSGFLSPQPSTHGPGRPVRSSILVVVLSSVLLHVVLALVLALILIATPPAPVEVAFADAGTVADDPPREVMQEVARRSKSSATSAAPKAAIATQSPSTFSIPIPDIRTSAPGRIGGMGDATIGDQLGMPGGVINPMGNIQGLASDLRGTYYDLKLKADGTPSGIDTVDEFKRFVNGWVASFSRERLSRFFQAPRQLYATHFWIPPRDSASAPDAFGVADKCKGNMWIAIYEGRIEAPESGDYRFWGAGDDYMVVRVDGRNVLDASFNHLHPAERSRADKNAWPMTGNNHFWDGKWVRMEKGRTYRIEVFLGEGEGGLMSFFLQVEKRGTKYDRFRDGRPVLPIFTVREFDASMKAIVESVPTPSSPSTFAGPVFQAR